MDINSIETKNLVMVTLQKELLKRKAVIGLMYDDNVRLGIDCVSKPVEYKTCEQTFEEIYEYLLDKLGNQIIKSKIEGRKVLINKPIYDRLICNLDHM